MRTFNIIILHEHDIINVVKQLINTKMIIIRLSESRRLILMQ